MVPLARQTLVDMLDAPQLAKFGLNLNADTPDANTLGEKWETLTIMPLNDPAAPDDALLLIGCDNDFNSTNVYHNGVKVGTNATTS